MKTKFFLLIAFFATFSTITVSAQNFDNSSIKDMTEEFFSKPSVYSVLAMTMDGEVKSTSNMVALISKEIFGVQNLDTKEVLIVEDIIPNLETADVNWRGDVVTKRVYRTKTGLLLLAASKAKIQHDNEDLEIYILSIFIDRDEKKELMTLLLQYVGEWK
ncbi:MAG: hypothetical protein IIV16_02100 [Alistipes sp.]|nr:hypothetical protein [Alistipes sp.]